MHNLFPPLWRAKQRTAVVVINTFKNNQNLSFTSLHRVFVAMSLILWKSDRKKATNKPTQWCKSSMLLLVVRLQRHLFIVFGCPIVFRQIVWNSINGIIIKIIRPLRGTHTPLIGGIVKITEKRIWRRTEPQRCLLESWQKQFPISDLIEKCRSS